MKRSFSSTVKRTLGASALGLCLTFASNAANAALIDLGFSLDESGSVGATNFNLTRDALAQALSVIPTSGANQYRVAVSTYSTGYTTVVAPTILTAANIGNVQAMLQATTFSGGGTDTALAINNLAAEFVNAGGLGDVTLLNITTDGSPNSQTAAVQAGLDVFALGVDGLSFEAIGSSQTLINQMAAIALPKPSVIVTDINNIPNATVNGFVIPVNSFQDYAAAIQAKIGQIVIDTGGGGNGVPVPAALPLLGLGLLALRGAKASQQRRLAVA